jgi:hypothetical protein
MNAKTTTKPTAAEIAAGRREYVATVDAQIAEMREALATLSRAILGDGYIIRTGGADYPVYLTFTVNPDRIVNSPRTSAVHKAMRFTREDAHRIAPSITNGSGQKGEAVHVLDAIRAEIESQQKTRDYVAALITE